ncbi:uncharacterized protein BX664DRAFT_292855 [Halteromyces radiatus]|uniref:uncharacterized protein n=1 Tax=Halteromyces radiatus TaxID=101107 RepID=UPI00221E5964|nr:uncharacterized protein BX664DRAFT_292855 [Halteromyces radiatus]KAI8097354.1 hypothetical protein BX664DRAFT_292855 [Halteromyces radiatus]
MASAKNFFTTGRNIIAIGRNFSEHAKELGNAVPTSPFYFLKPTSSYLANGGIVEIPKGCEVHHEIELAVVIGKTGRDIKKEDAMNHIAGYALAIDMTARNVQNEAKKKGLPWSTAKGFDTFTPISDFIPKERISDPSNVNLWLKVNDVYRQNGNTKDMIFNVPSLVEYVSSIMKLETGDVMLTGTPKGVGQIVNGDVITCGLRVGSDDKDLVNMRFDVKDRQNSSYSFK